MEKNKTSVKDRVLAAIETGKAKMRPRWHFIMKTALVVAGGALLLLLLLYLASFIVFSLRQTGAWFAPVFGFTGWLSLFRHLPWLLICLSITFIVVLELLVRRHSFAYRKPLLYSAISLVLIAVIGGIFIAPLHRGLFASLRSGGGRQPLWRIPLIGDLYRNFGMERFRDIHRGTITATTTSGFVMEDLRGETSTVIVTPATRRNPANGLGIGKLVIVFGDQDDRLIRALGIREISE